MIWILISDGGGTVGVGSGSACTCVFVFVCKYVSTCSKWRKRSRLYVTYSSSKNGEYLIFLWAVCSHCGECCNCRIPPSEAGWCRVWNRAMPVGWTWQAPSPASFPNQTPFSAMYAQPCCSHYWVHCVRMRKFFIYLILLRMSAPRVQLLMFGRKKAHTALVVSTDCQHLAHW